MEENQGLLTRGVQPPRIRPIFLILGVLSAGGAAAYWLNQPCTDLATVNQAALKIGKRATAELVKVPVADAIELDGKSKAEVFALRRERLVATPALFDVAAYKPSEMVFGRIEDGLPWWGLEGIYLHGPGPHSSAGPSEESRWLVNPAVLLGLEENFSPLWTRKPEVSHFEPRLLNIAFRPKERLLRIDYDVSNLLGLLVLIHNKDAGVGLMTRNAQDFGFNFTYLDSKQSYRVKFEQSPLTVQQLKQFVHRGSSCGQPSGCNNTSPPTPALDFAIEDIPASVFARLWYQEPDDPEDKPDLNVVIEMQATAAQQIDGVFVPDLCHSEWYYRKCFAITPETCVATARQAFTECFGREPAMLPGNDRRWDRMQKCVHEKFVQAEGVTYTPDAPGCAAVAGKSRR